MRPGQSGVARANAKKQERESGRSFGSGSRSPSRVTPYILKGTLVDLLWTKGSVLRATFQRETKAKLPVLSTLEYLFGLACNRKTTFFGCPKSLSPRKAHIPQLSG